MDKLTFTRKEAANYCSVSLPTLDAYLQRSHDPMPSIHAGRKIIIPVEGLRKWLLDEAARQAGA